MRGMMVDCDSRRASIENILGKDYDLDKLRRLVEADRDGRCYIYPVKIGDFVYVPNSIGVISQYRVISIHNYYFSTLFRWHLLAGLDSNSVGFEISALGKTVFLTYEEAKAAMKRIGKG